MAGQRVQRVGVDCVQLVAAVLDELARLDAPTPVPRMPQDSGASDRWSDAVLRVMHAITARHPADVVDDGELQPGDIVLCRLGAGGGPGHAMIVGGEPQRIYHASRPAGRVVYTGTQGVEHLARVWRVRDRHRWLETRFRAGRS